MKPRRMVRVSRCPRCDSTNKGSVVSQCLECYTVYCSECTVDRLLAKCPKCLIIATRDCSKPLGVIDIESPVYGTNSTSQLLHRLKPLPYSALSVPPPVKKDRPLLKHGSLLQRMCAYLIDHILVFVAGSLTMGLIFRGLLAFGWYPIAGLILPDIGPG